jgi:hypothetical protein
MANRSFPGGRFALFMDGEALGFIKSVSGGQIKGEVATHNMGPHNLVKKHLATISHGDITCEIGMGMGKGLYEWIRSSFDMSHITKSGEVVAADFDYKAQRATVFYDAHITECTFPALDASSKEPAYMTIKIDPEKLRYEKRGGEKLSAKMGTKTKKWLPSAFDFELGTLPCERVNKIDSFTLKQGVVMDQVGKFREATKHAAKVEVPNLKVTFSASDAKPWEDWFRTFVIEGKCADGDELNGQIRFLGPDHTEELGRIELYHVGIISLQPAKYEANKEEVARLEAELYVEEMKLHFNEVDA